MTLRAASNCIEQSNVLGVHTGMMTGLAGWQRAADDRGGSLDAGLQQLGPLWMVYADFRAAAPDGPIVADYLLLHPDFGIALVDGAPGGGGLSDKAAVEGLRKFLLNRGIGEFFPGYLPIVRLRADSANPALLGRRIVDAFAGVPVLTIRDKEWAQSVATVLAAREPNGNAPAAPATVAAAAKPLDPPPTMPSRPTQARDADGAGFRAGDRIGTSSAPSAPRRVRIAISPEGRVESQHERGRNAPAVAAAAKPPDPPPTRASRPTQVRDADGAGFRAGERIGTSGASPAPRRVRIAISPERRIESQHEPSRNAPAVPAAVAAAAKSPDPPPTMPSRPTQARDADGAGFRAGERIGTSSASPAPRRVRIAVSPERRVESPRKPSPPLFGLAIGMVIVGAMIGAGADWLTRRDATDGDIVAAIRPSTAERQADTPPPVASQAPEAARAREAERAAAMTRDVAPPSLPTKSPAPADADQAGDRATATNAPRPVPPPPPEPPRAREAARSAAVEPGPASTKAAAPPSPPTISQAPAEADQTRNRATATNTAPPVLPAAPETPAARQAERSAAVEPPGRASTKEAVSPSLPALSGTPVEADRAGNRATATNTPAPTPPAPKDVAPPSLPTISRAPAEADHAGDRAAATNMPPPPRPPATSLSGEAHKEPGHGLPAASGSVQPPVATPGQDGGVAVAQSKPAGEPARHAARARLAHESGVLRRAGMPDGISEAHGAEPHGNGPPIDAADLPPLDPEPASARE
jgi:hypothetical protein